MQPPAPPPIFQPVRGNPDYGDKRPDLLSSAIQPIFKFRAHNAPLGIHFLDSAESLPGNLNKSALVALHGSWNRSSLDGYKVVALHWDKDGNISSSDFMSGFLTEAGVSAHIHTGDATQNIFMKAYFPFANNRVAISFDGIPNILNVEARGSLVSYLPGH